MFAPVNYHQAVPHHPLQNLLNLSFSPKKGLNQSLAKHNTFMISDKMLKNSPKFKSRPKVIINDFYELKKTGSEPINQAIKTSPGSRKSLLNLLSIESPGKKQSTGKMRDLHIYSDLKGICRDLVQKSTNENKSNEQKTPKTPKFSKKLRMLKGLQHEYFSLQKKSIENYLKGEHVNNQLIEMDFFEFTKLKRARLVDYISNLEVNRKQTPIDQIFAQKPKPSFKVPNRVSSKQLSPDKYQKSLEFLNEVIARQSRMLEFMDSKQDQIQDRMMLYNKYYLNYFTPPDNPDRVFTSLKDLAVPRLSLTKDLIAKTPNYTPNRPTFNKLHPQRTISKDQLKSSHHGSRELASGVKPQKTKELAGVGVLENIKRKLEEQEIEYVRKEGEQLKKWKKELDDKKELDIEEREFFKAVKEGDSKKASFFLIDNKPFVHIRDQIRQTPLHWAAKRGYMDLVRILLENGADIVATDMVGRTPKQLAYASGFKEVFSLLQSTEEYGKKQEEFRKTISKGQTIFHPRPE